MVFDDLESRGERDPRRSAEIRGILDNFGFAGVRMYTRELLIVRMRTRRHDVTVTTGIDDTEHFIRVDRGLRIVNVDPANNTAWVTDIIRSPGWGRSNPGMLRRYILTDFFSNAPGVSALGDEYFERGDMLGLRVQENGYIKVFYPRDPGVGYKRAAKRLATSGELTEAEAFEFSVPELVAWAIDTHNALQGARPEVGG